MTRQTQLSPERTDLPRPPENTPRLRLKPKSVRTGHVDGAWWPHSRDLHTELPDLLAVLAVRLGAIQVVKYDTHGWSASPRLAAAQHRSVMMSGSQFQPANTLHVVGANRKQLVLLVVPPHTNPDEAHSTMMHAADPDNVDTTDELLLISRRDVESRSDARNAEHRWASDGGQLAE